MSNYTVTSTHTKYSSCPSQTSFSQLDRDGGQWRSGYRWSYRDVSRYGCESASSGYSCSNSNQTWTSCCWNRIGFSWTMCAVAAYILLSLYPVPTQHWEEDRTWLYLGMAIRFATDLNLHRPAALPSSSHSTVARLTRSELELREREVLNRTRIWINCFNLDRSTSSWHGKASTINNDNDVGSRTEAWYSNSEWNLKGFDIHLAAYNAELRMLAEFRRTVYSDPSHPQGLNKVRVYFFLFVPWSNDLYRESISKVWL